MEIINRYPVDLREILDNETNLEYIGDIDSDGKLKGNGSIKNENILVKGNFIDGCLRVENCSINIKNGISYEGDIELGLFTGKSCTLLMPCNSKYIGEMRHSAPHGSGRFLYSNGTYYMGNWDNGVKEGVGMQIDREENYIGNWRIGDKHGSGLSVVCNITFTVTYENGVETSRITKKEFDAEAKIKEIKKEMLKKNENIANLQVKLLLKEGYLESLEKITIEDFCQLHLKINNLKEEIETKDKKLEKIENMVNCKVCYVNISNIIIRPCNHLVLCNECNENARISTFNRCPLCKENCESTEKVFW